MEMRRRSERVAKVIVETVTKKTRTKKVPVEEQHQQILSIVKPEIESNGNAIVKQETPSIPTDEKLSALRTAAKLLRSTGMKIGYPCLCTSLCTPCHIFRLANYTNEKCLEVTNQNLTCLQRILEYNIEHGFHFFRIGSQTVPFASHPVCTVDWLKHFSSKLRQIGQYIKDNDCRISMHPDQFCLINAKDDNIIQRSIAELDYHCQLLDEMQLDASAKIQIHVGGIYGDKQVRSFMERSFSWQ